MPQDDVIDDVIVMSLYIYQCLCTHQLYSGLTGSGGHRGHTMCHKERLSQTLTFGERIMFLALTIFK